MSIYRFRVGVCNLGSSLGSLGSSGYNHACLLLNTDLFEYGCGKSHCYERRKEVGREDKYDWDSLGEALNGTTTISPDQLETAINNSGNWTGEEYNALNHNCHDFVQFCLDRIGCPESMIKKVGPCYKHQ